jgi:hypothetical protein
LDWASLLSPARIAALSLRSADYRESLSFHGFCSVVCQDIAGTLRAALIVARRATTARQAIPSRKTFSSERRSISIAARKETNIVNRQSWTWGWTCEWADFVHLCVIENNMLNELGAV